MESAVILSPDEKLEVLFIRELSLSGGPDVEGGSAEFSRACSCMEWMFDVCPLCLFAEDTDDILLVPDDILPVPDFGF